MLRILPASITMLVVLLLSACGQDSPSAGSAAVSTSPTAPAIPVVTFTATDTEYAAPTSISAGLVNVVLVNHGTEAHVLQFVQLNDGVTFAQFQSTVLQNGPLAFRTLGKIAGGVGVIPPGAQGEVTLTMAAGNYVALSPIPAKDGKRQYLKGLISAFSANASTAVVPAAPVTNGQVVIKGFSITLPSNIKAGPQLWQVSNVGDQPYEMGVVKLAAGKTSQDVLAFYRAPSGPPPFLNLGGMGSIGPHFIGWVKFNLVAGDYVALSQVLDAATGKPDYELGMVTPFTVS